MFYGFWVEARADVQKSVHKDALREASAAASVEPTAKPNEEEVSVAKAVTHLCPWVATGERAKSRRVNYFGEVVFWAGSALAATPSFGRQPLPWLCAGLGLTGIAKVMVEATQRLDKKHKERYGSDPAWRAYAESTPRLWPRPGSCEGLPGNKYFRDVSGWWRKLSGRCYRFRRHLRSGPLQISIADPRQGPQLSVQREPLKMTAAQSKLACSPSTSGIT